MKQKITFLFLLLLSCSGLIFGQTMVNDFETGSSGLLSAGGGITAGVVVNPNPTGMNTTANCLEIKRTGAQWWILQGIDVSDIAISTSETKYLSMLVHYPAQSDLGIRFDAPDDTSNGTGIVRGLNAYTNFNQWQEIVFEIKQDGGTNPASLEAFDGTLFRISFHPDMGFENDPAGQVLDNISAFGYIDQIQILDSNPLSTSNFELEKNISLYPNPAESAFKITRRNNVQITDVSVYDVLGKKVMRNITRINTDEYDVSNLASGLYVVKVIDSNGDSVSKKLLKN